MFAADEALRKIASNKLSLMGNAESINDAAWRVSSGEQYTSSATYLFTRRVTLRWLKAKSR